jgi:Na+/H+ antiporter NhaD/arsenite permease-like protein
MTDSTPLYTGSTDTVALMTSIIFGLTYLFLAVGKVPRLRIDRAGIALVGAAALLAVRVLGLDEAARAMDVPTIVLLFGMMIVVAYVRISGFFGVVTSWIASRRLSPHGLLAMTIGLAGVLSAFLVNDVVCVAMTPLVLDLCRRRNLSPLPYLIGLATASNIGSVATITGNPQNIIIGNLSGISYVRFAARLAPVAALGLVVDFVVLSLVYSRALAGGASGENGTTPEVAEPRVHRGLLAKCLCVTAAMIALFFAGQPIAIVALAAAAILLLDRVRPEKVYHLIDWPLLVMFAGLFIVVHAFEVQVVRSWNLESWTALRDSPVVLVSGLSVLLSNLVSNVPAVLLFKPLMEVMTQKEQAWLALAMSSTLAGNLTMLGSVANLIVVESARRARVELGFGEFLKVGIPLTVLTTLVGVAWLALTHY